MRKPRATPVAATDRTEAADRVGNEPLELVCLALALAVIALAARIASIW